MKVSSCATRDNLDSIINAFEEFPASVNKSTMLYDYNKLLYIIRDKELSLIVNDALVIENVQQVSLEFGKLRALVNENPERGICLYNDLKKNHLTKFSGFAYLFVKQWAISIEALYYYKTDCMNLAQSLTLECIAFNDILIHEGLHSLVFRSAEQNRNLARVLMVSDSISVGAKLAGNVLDYLLNGSPKNLYGNIFKNTEYWTKNPYIREGYSYEYFRGLVHNILVANNSHLKQRELFDCYFKELSFDVTSPDRLIMSEWIKIKRAYYQGDIDEFLNLFIIYMKDQTTSLYDLLKVSLIQDIEHIYIVTGNGKSNNLKNKIIKYLDSTLVQYGYLKSFIKSYDKVI